VARRAVPAGFVVAAALADRSGSASAGFYLFLALVAVCAVIALNAYGELVEAPVTEGQDATTRRLQALLWAVLLGFAVLGAAVRAPALAAGVVPHLGATVVICCLLVLCTEGIVEVVAMSRRRPPIRRARLRVVADLEPEALRQNGNESEEAASFARSING
jgi:small-conductance mechanosensitive channel